MKLLISKVGDCLIPLRISVIRICTLVASLLFSYLSVAGELKELSVTEADGEYRLRIVSVLDAPADYVYDVITDYSHGYRINPFITEVEVLPSEHDEVVRVRNLSEHWVGPFCFKIDWVGDIVETKHGDIKIKTIPELSSFESGSAVWMIRPRGERTWLLHESSLKPKFFIPPVIGDYIMKRKMEDDTLATLKRIECHSKILLEIDMEHDPEFLKTLLREGQDCVNHQELRDVFTLKDQWTIHTPSVQ